MVEVDVQLLIGAAVTVFLALMFFGVVVLWDVALALRSVGDKIDKLEDNIDDDLADIGHALDGMSGGGGGGTQLHLSGGGTISSGPAPGQQADDVQEPRQGQQARPHGRPGPRRPTPGEDDHVRESAPERGPDSASAREHRPDATADATAAHEDGEAAQAGGARPGDEPASDETEPADDEATVADDERPDEGIEGESADEATDRPADEAPDPSRAERNRGRFAAPGDGTPWYAVRIDRTGARPAEPPIAGELPDGSEPDVDESEIIAAGPVESGHDGGGEAIATADSGTKPADESDTDGATPDEGAIEAPDGQRSESDGTSSPDGEVLEYEGEDATAEASASVASDDGGEADGESDADVTADGEPDLEPVGETAVETVHTEANDASEESVDEPTEPDDPASSTPLDDGVPSFEFESEPDAADRVTVVEAVEEINEDAPAPELSSHRFDVTGEIPDTDPAGTDESEPDGDDADDETDDVVLQFEFDDVDLTGSTKRLLRYQLQSYADRDETPECDLSIADNRVVVDLYDADGTDVKRWGDAAVSIVDRTLYLSDESPDDE